MKVLAAVALLVLVCLAVPAGATCPAQWNWTNLTCLTVNNWLDMVSNESLCLRSIPVNYVTNVTTGTTAGNLTAFNGAAANVIKDSLYSPALIISTVETWVSNQGYLTVIPANYVQNTSTVVTAGNLTKYSGTGGNVIVDAMITATSVATQAWVTAQGYLASIPVNYVTNSSTKATAGNLTSFTGAGGNVIQDALITATSVATQAWVTAQGYITSSALTAYDTIANQSTWINTKETIANTSTQLNLKDTIANQSTWINSRLPLAGGTMTGNIAMGTKAITGLVSTSDMTSAVNRTYAGTHGATTASNSAPAITHSLGTTPTGCFVTGSLTNTSIDVVGLTSTTFLVNGTKTGTTTYTAMTSQTVYWECWV